MGEFVAGGRKVPAGNGWKWIVEGWNLFTRAPGPWIGVTVIWMLISIAVGLFPLLGSIATVVLNQVFLAGLLIGSRALAEGGELKVEHLFAGFRERFGTLAAVGLLYLLAMLVAALIAGLLVGFKLIGLFEALIPQIEAAQVDPILALQVVVVFLLAFLIWLVLMVPVIMAIWFAPALVVFDGLDALAAIKASFSGCLRNMLPFLVYSVILLIPACIATIPVALGWLILGPLVVASIYASYRDIYFTQ